MKAWFDVQWKDSKGATCVTHILADDVSDANTQFRTEYLPKYTRNGYELKSIDFILPNGPLPLTPGCCIR